MEDELTWQKFCEYIKKKRMTSRTFHLIADENSHRALLEKSAVQKSFTVIIAREVGTQR